MKAIKTNLAAIALLLFVHLAANAKTWRVNKISDYLPNNASRYGANVGGTIEYPVFKELEEAQEYNAVLNGDTVHLEGCASGDEYSSAIITKRLVIIGTGYFLAENPDVSNDLLASRIASLEFEEGSAGSQVIGVWIRAESGVGGILRVDESNITIKRCKIDWYLYLGRDLADIYIIGNYFDNINQPTFSAIEIDNSNFPVNVVIKNNIFKKKVLLQSGNLVGTVLQCHNNVFDCPAAVGAPSLKLNSISFQNNILTTAGATVEINGGSGNGITFNTSASASGQFGSAANNIVAVDMASLFLSGGTSDGKYRLNPSAPDNIPGSDGTERGAFGGTAISNRYSISGLAPIPVIYEISTSGVSDATGLPVTIKARTIK